MSVHTDTKHPEEYRCMLCGHAVNARFATEEGRSEFVENYPNDDIAEGVVVCTDCYRKARTLEKGEVE